MTSLYRLWRSGDLDKYAPAPEEQAFLKQVKERTVKYCSIGFSAGLGFSLLVFSRARMNLIGKVFKFVNATAISAGGGLLGLAYSAHLSIPEVLLLPPSSRLRQDLVRVTLEYNPKGAAEMARYVKQAKQKQQQNPDSSTPSQTQNN
eukprot:TRINITY_DN7488_c0_g1_i1.p1 TRINITY_DN7488_c0_g1~~TRINITY_DN7488_c0_g1_i1.p1  ORF type:complete len:147 (+),score=25.20 TRINITY_DN7488_c0_g1_i1:101-541(+)